MSNDSLGDRMKKYEESTDYRIISRIPIVVRLDGKSFSKLTKKLKFQKPFDRSFSFIMSETAKAVASAMQGCMIGYTQSDEMTFVLRSDQSLDTTPWFDNRIQKIVSVASSTAGAIFNSILPVVGGGGTIAAFDCRAHPVPNLTEAFNNLIWRQNDCIKNSISSACYYEVGKVVGKKTARKLMHKKNQNEQLELLLEKAHIDWETYAGEFKYGTVVFREEQKCMTPNGEAIRKRWVKTPAPVFLGDGGRAWLINTLSHEASDEEK